ncbi:LysR family transcriptional regulator [Alisedimentitalea sp. MJ-SS2]|uniref:LysR family transcriptional regulator n=1 Tax=Aliisedimentitalea sp. MJ-SS2 TaxID=3049795 RepID=UPI0029100330|nr:LysR family transcriptional regulator [Alisedimentitalea sp. MJ-SS2]MDU8927656.1 LysR family transcriptional regulator [Alisedimentitalea sp. MJ-SS2]
MAQINLKQLEAFVQVADLASFRRAAEKLNTTQPNISARISGLETQLGQRLFVRDAGSVRPTPHGTALLPKARAVLRGMDDFLVAAGEDHLFDGILRLGVTEMIVHTWLGQFLTAMKNRFPNIDVDLTVDVSANLSPPLFGRAIDLTFQSGPFDRQASGMEPLGDFPFIWVAAPDHGFGDKVLSLSHLSRYPVLTHARGTLPHQQLLDHVAGSPTAVSVRVVPSTNLAACLQMTRDGFGVACLPAAIVESDLERGHLSQLRYLWVPDALSFHARFDADTTPAYVGEAAKLARDISLAHAGDHK